MVIAIQPRLKSRAYDEGTARCSQINEEKNMEALQPVGKRVSRQIVIEYDVPCELTDGSILYADIARPAGAGNWPVMLLRTPYNKAQAFLRFDLAASALLGFVAIIQDTRNRGKSTGSGEFVPFVQEAQDGAEAVQWSASLPYSNGEVFMTGGSYQGFTQWAAASQQPSALRGINPIDAPGNFRRTMVYRGGVLELECNAFWWTMMGTEMLMRRDWDNPGDIQAALLRHAAKFEALWTERGLESLPLDQFGSFVGSPLGEAAFSLFREDGAGPTMTAAAQAQQYEHIAVPALVVGGWYDIFIQGTIDQFVGMRSRGGTAEARDKTRLVIGPWSHMTVGHQVTGEHAYPMSATIHALNSYGMTGFAAQYFKEIASSDASKASPVKIWVMGADRWRDEQEWPLARTQMTPWYLASGGQANTLTGDGVISPVISQGPADRFIYDPANPVPTHGGAVLGVTTLAGTRDQRPIEAREDVLVYTSSPLLEDMEVTGTAVMELWASTDAADTDFIARIADVDPDGAAMLVTDGVIRARYRNNPDGFQPSEPLAPGIPYLFRIELLPTSYMFKKGHRLRVDITSSCFPRWARNLNIWDEWGGGLADARIAHQEVFHDREHPSCMILPIIPPQS